MTTLITGASSGIGAAFARRLAAEKFDLLLVARSGDKLQKLCEELTARFAIKAYFIALDLSESNADLRVWEFVNQRGLQIDWLINNAGFGNFGEFAANDLQREMNLIDLNVRALVALTHRFLPAMRERKSGVIINVASTAAFQPVPLLATYAASKAFVASFSEALWDENRARGIHVLALCPGATDTEFFDRANANGKPPGRQIETPETVVETALRAVRAKKSVAISGRSNRLTARIANFIPHEWTTKIVGRAQRTRKNF